jgi:16S rRNA (cytosine967-C5)-methyltransferase
MDDGSRLVAELAAASLPSGLDAPRVWDCCAAPGGKTLMLALRLPHADILATDVSARRLALTKARLHRHSYVESIRTQVADTSNHSASLGSDPIASFDLILCDVPCSGTGTLTRNPEIRHILRIDDLSRQAARQRPILAGAASRLAPGGRIVYSTCSLEPEENEYVVDTVASELGLQRIPIEPLLASLTAKGILAKDSSDSFIFTAVRDGALRTLPGIHPCDGFFAVVLERA